MPQIADWMPEFSGITRDGKFVMKSHETTAEAVGGEVVDDRAERRGTRARAPPNIRPLKTTCAALSFPLAIAG